MTIDEALTTQDVNNVSDEQREAETKELLESLYVSVLLRRAAELGELPKTNACYAALCSLFITGVRTGRAQARAAEIVRRAAE